MQPTRQARRKAWRATEKARVKGIRNETVKRRIEGRKQRKAARPHVPATAEQRERSRQHAIAQEANTRTRRILAPGERNRSILIEFVQDGVEHSYHATKGWRRVRKEIV